MPGSIGPNPAWYLALDAVSETDPYVRPWKPPRKATRFPSISSIVRPSPRTGTIGYTRGRLGDVQRWSYSTWARALGPGISVTRSGTGRAAASREGADVTRSTSCRAEGG